MADKSREVVVRRIKEIKTKMGGLNPSVMEFQSLYKEHEDLLSYYRDNYERFIEEDSGSDQ